MVGEGGAKGVKGDLPMREGDHAFWRRKDREKRRKYCSNIEIIVYLGESYF